MSAQLDAISALHAPVQRLCAAFLDAFPGSAIASGRRGVDDQARADAELCAEARRRTGRSYANTISATYVASPVRDAMVRCGATYYMADAEALASAFAFVLGSFDDAALSHFSLHLSGNAVDFEPVGDPRREEWCREWVARCPGLDLDRSRVLTVEAGLPRLHVQLVERSST